MNNPGNLKKKILLVEDDEDLQKSYLMRLSAIGFDVVLAQDGQSALDLVSQDIPDLILMDMILPRVNGFKVCEQIKDSEKTKNIPIIVMSALTQPASHKKAIDCGADAFFLKPFDWDALNAKIMQLLKLP